jgi:CsoR family transcriptional regulator, copper-sensing transcriptional repressor
MNEHNHPQSKAVINRMSRLIGHMESIKKMTEDGRDCSEILIQISAVRSALNGVGKIILEDHINHCVVEAVENNNKQVLGNLLDAIDKFIGTNSKNFDGSH